MDLSNISLTSWAGLVAAGAVITSCWRHVVAALRLLGDIVVCRTALREEASQAVQSYCWTHGRRSPFGLRVFGGERSWVAPRRRVEVIGYETFSSDAVLVWFQGRPAVLALSGGGRGTPALGGSGNPSNIYPAFLWTLRPWPGLRWLGVDVDAFVDTALCAFNELHHVPKAGEAHDRPRRFHVVTCGGERELVGHAGGNKADLSTPAHAPPSGPGDIQDLIRTRAIRLLRWKPEDLVARGESTRAFEFFPYPATIMTALQEIQTWIECEAWFRSKGVPWRRGWLLHGPPGTGKSNLARCIGMHFDLPMYAADLATMDNGDLRSLFRKAQSNAPAIVLLEDLDTVFHGRVNVHAAGKQRDMLTFDCLLNTISGAGNSEGIFLIGTTNKLEILDPALGVPDGTGRSTRPGRFDRALYVGPMELPQRQQLAALILSDFEDMIEATVAAGEGETAAQFQDRCASLAERLFWESKRGERRRLAA